MRKLLTTALCAALALSLSGIGAAAYQPDGLTNDVWTGMTIEKALYIQDDTILYSEMNEAYEDSWWEGEVPELDDLICRAAVFGARGFAVSPDGRYSYWGTLNNRESGVRGAVVLDMRTGKTTDIFTHYDGAYVTGDPVPFSWPKGIAADDRGYVYVGFAFLQNFNIVNLGIARQESDGTLSETYMGPVYEFGTPGDSAGIHVGVNGVDVAKEGDRYLCYAVLNYDYDALYCLDVTDPARPTLNTEFGENGMIVFSDDSCEVKGDGFTLEEGYYLDVDPDGTIWLCAKSKEGSAGIMKIDASGSSCVAVIPDPDCYCVEHVGPYLLVGAKNGLTLTVLDDASYEQVAKIELPAGYGERVTRVQVVGDVLYTMLSNEHAAPTNVLYAAPLNADGEAYLSDLAANLAQAEAPTEVPTQVPTEAPTGTPTATPTEAPQQPGAEPSSGAPGRQTEAGPGDAKDGKSGCRSLIGAEALLMAAVAAAAALRRRRD